MFPPPSQFHHPHERCKPNCYHHLPSCRNRSILQLTIQLCYRYYVTCQSCHVSVDLHALIWFAYTCFTVAMVTVFKRVVWVPLKDLTLSDRCRPCYILRMCVQGPFCVVVSVFSLINELCTSFLLTTQLESSDWRKRTTTWRLNSWPTL